MGHGSSKHASNAAGEPSERTPLRRRLCIFRRHSGGAADPQEKHLSVEEFAGIACIEIVRAEMKFKDKWLACLSIGERTYRTEKSDQTKKPEWNSKKKIILERDGPRIARISVFETNRLSKNNLVGYCEFDLWKFFSQETESNELHLDLLNPSCANETVGTVSLCCYIEDPFETERSFVRSVLAVVDHDADGQLSFSEFSELVDAFGNQIAAGKKEELFRQADTNGDGIVSMDELAVHLAAQQERESLISSCPVCGENLGKFDRLNGMIHLTLCFDEGNGNQTLTGGFLTDKQASYGWMFKLSEWVHFSSYDVGLNSGSSASHIVVYDRRSKRLVEEIIAGKIILSMRAIYQSKVGLALIDSGAKDLLQKMSEKQGKRMNSPESAKDIPKFLEVFKDQIKLDEVKYPIEQFKTFNEFFTRELKPGARPIASEEHEEVAVCAADSRLMAFNSIDDSLRFWIKGRKFSVGGLLGNAESLGNFRNGCLVIFRLAPQDYHRFHFPVSGTIEEFFDIPGCLYTVNPIAVNSKYCNVFTENKRVVALISTPKFGKVAFVAIGATMVGSIKFLRKKGEDVKKGEEFGYFAFGGSTVICVFEKDVIQIDEDLLANSERSLETLVSVGMTLGISRRTNS